MPQHETKSCPRCGKCFECKVGDIAHCQCSSVRLSERTLDFLNDNQYDCLCKQCLMELNELTAFAKDYQFPKNKEDFLEGIHYYQEGGYWVFTELYHYLRGSCCGNGCRHCVYSRHLK